MESTLECVGLTIGVNGRTLVEHLDLSLEPGAMVCALGRTKVGELEEVITTDSGMATHIVVTMSDSSLDRKAIPMHWVDEISENEIHLGATLWMVQAIEMYDPHLSPMRG